MNEEILKRIDLLAAKLDTTAAHLWAVLIRQAHIQACQDCIMLALSIAGWIALYQWVRWFWENDKGHSCAGRDLNITGIPITCIVLVVVTLVYLAAIPTELFNPEYFALHEILTAIK